jgi:hypothetical protein
MAASLAFRVGAPKSAFHPLQTFKQKRRKRVLEYQGGHFAEPEEC